MRWAPCAIPFSQILRGMWMHAWLCAFDHVWVVCQLWFGENPCQAGRFLNENAYIAFTPNIINGVTQLIGYLCWNTLQVPQTPTCSFRVFSADQSIDRRKRLIGRFKETPGAVFYGSGSSDSTTLSVESSAIASNWNRTLRTSHPCAGLSRNGVRPITHPLNYARPK